jgi:rhamnosyltransferase subunit B
LGRLRLGALSWGMRILIQTLGSAGDVHPFVSLGSALKARGHEVLLWGVEPFRDLIQEAGLAFQPIGETGDYEDVQANPDLWHPRRGLRLIMEEVVVPSLEPTIESMLGEVRAGETLVVGSTLGLAARMVREIAEVPMVSVHLAPCVFRSNVRAPRFAGLWAPDWTPRWFKRAWWWLSDRIVDPMVCPALNAVGARHGLAPVRAAFGEWIHSPDSVLALFPDWFAPRQPDWPRQVRTTGFPLFDQSETHAPNPELEAWLDAGPAPIVVTAGSANVHGRDFYAASVDACRRLGQRALLVTSNRDLLPDTLPDDVRHEAYVPFSRVLPQATALISHGGIGTTAHALAAGTPHLVRSLAFDQLDNASRLIDLGVGACLPAGRYTARRAERLLAGLLGSARVRSACAAVKQRMPAPDAVLEETCRLMEGVRTARA